MKSTAAQEVLNSELLKKFRTMADKNKPTEKNAPRVEPKAKKSKKSSSFSWPSVHINPNMFKSASTVLDGSVLTSDLIQKSVPYLIMLFLLAMIYIGNNFIAQSKVKKIDQLGKELKDLRDEHISTKSDLMFSTKQSELAKRLSERQIQEATTPPYKIYIPKKEVNP